MSPSEMFSLEGKSAVVIGGGGVLADVGFQAALGRFHLGHGRQRVSAAQGRG